LSSENASGLLAADDHPVPWPKTTAAIRSLGTVRALTGSPWEDHQPLTSGGVRLEDAADLVRYTTDAVGVIASEVSYDSEAAFSRVFSKRYGAPPSRWRREPI